jgi:hypothetical protein
MATFKYALIYDDTLRPKWWKHPIKWWKFRRPLIATIDLTSTDLTPGLSNFEITFPSKDDSNG